MRRQLATIAILAGVTAGAGLWTNAGRVWAREEVIHVLLSYAAPGSGPAPNFSPKGTQVALTPVAETLVLPAGATRPAKSGTMKIGTDPQSWIPVLATADAEHPHDLCRLFVDVNRNGVFTDDQPGLSAVPAQNDKTKAWWTSFNKVELSVPYARTKVMERYLVNFWIVRDGDATPDVVRYSVGSWRYGTAVVDGIPALVAAMDGDNDAIFSAGDYWSVLQASAPDAAKAVLSHTEARQTNRLMFLQDGARELVLEFRSFSVDGRSIDFAVVDRPATKAADRAGDDVLAVERARPRAKAPFTWGHDLPAALALAKTSGRKIFIDFETTWCGPCKSMDEWVWTDAEVAGILNGGYIGVKLDGDIEKALVKQYAVIGYPTMVVLDASGAEAGRVLGYQSSAEMAVWLKPSAQPAAARSSRVATR